MRAVVQRVARAAVRVEDQVVGQIGAGLLVLLGVGQGDQADAAGQMNRSVLDTRGDLLAVSQFTLYADTRRGRRPGYSAAAPPEEANRLYRHFVGRLRESGLRVEEGVFRAMMDVSLVNQGPVTILLDSAKTF
ncbi:MAG: D-tyrosyl-tRNA(Tyr) deacylase [Acidobacteria bacterium]|nr:MAG: D-tyrosyl-tRNA(Tyr) deacylase [Acidobacteriota bacterium]